MIPEIVTEQNFEMWHRLFLSRQEGKEKRQSEQELEF